MIEIIDNIIEDHIAQLIDSEIRNTEWRYDYHSLKDKPNKHWNKVICDHEYDQDFKGYDGISMLWDQIKIKDYKLRRCYLNAHTHGIEPHLHGDDGDYTMIYYPRLDWNTEKWGGGTRVGNEIADYKGNRLIIFPAKTLHQAMPVTRECFELRTCVVFKTER